VAPTARRIDEREARALLEVLRPHAVAAGGMWEPDARSLDVAGLLAGYVAGARRNGATVLRASEVVELQTTSSGWRLELATATGDAVVDADVVVDAAGAWGDVVAARAGVAPIGLLPMRRTAALVALPDGIDAAAWPLVMDVAGRCYFEPESAGLLLSPADEHPTEPCDARPEELDVAWSLDVLADTTTLEVRRVRRAWAGLRTFAHDRQPVIGWEPSAPGFCWLVGQGGAGIKTAPAAAAAVASLVGGRPWPEELAALGVTAGDLAPRRAPAAA
jgi:D-arginine dehydrogenase